MIQPRQPQIVYEYLDPPQSVDELLALWLSAQSGRATTVVSSDQVGENTDMPTPKFNY